MTAARALWFTLKSDSDRYVFKRLMLGKTVIPLASLVSTNDGLRFDLRDVIVTGKSYDATRGYAITVRFMASHVTCGPPTCESD